MENANVFALCRPFQKRGKIDSSLRRRKGGHASMLRRYSEQLKCRRLKAKVQLSFLLQKSLRGECPTSTCPVLPARRRDSTPRGLIPCAKWKRAIGHH